MSSRAASGSVTFVAMPVKRIFGFARLAARRARRTLRMERRSATWSPPGNGRSGISASNRRASGILGRFVLLRRSGSMTTSSPTPSRASMVTSGRPTAGADHGDLHRREQGLPPVAEPACLAVIGRVGSGR
jgi:hypothetical protein